MTNQKEIMDKIKAIFSGHITDLEVKEIMDIFDEYKLEVREEVIDSLNKTFLGIVVAVVMVNGKATGEAMLESWKQALDKLKDT